MLRCEVVFGKMTIPIGNCDITITEPDVYLWAIQRPFLANEHVLVNLRVLFTVVMSNASCTVVVS